MSKSVEGEKNKIQLDERARPHSRIYAYTHLHFTSGSKLGDGQLIS